MHDKIARFGDQIWVRLSWDEKALQHGQTVPYPSLHPERRRHLQLRNILEPIRSLWTFALWPRSSAPPPRWTSLQWPLAGHPSRSPPRPSATVSRIRTRSGC